jgi:hypothetical protein
VSAIFPNLCTAEISPEMSTFYTALVISAVFGVNFEEEFVDVCNDYDFTN